MKRWCERAVFLVGFLIIGCAGHFDVPMATNVAIQPAVMQKIPLNVAILVTDQMENYKETAVDEADLLGTTYTFPLGQMIKKFAPDVLSTAFQKALVVKGEPYPPDIDTIIVPKVERFQLRLPAAGFSREAVVEISVTLAAYDIDGQLVWQETIKSPAISGRRPFIGTEGLLNATGSAAAESIVAVMQKAAQEMSASPSIQAYLSPKGGGQTIASQAATRQGPAIASDVEEPPTRSLKPNFDAFAIVIGIETYRQDLPKADFAVRDAQTMARYLTKVMGYPEENIVTLINDRALKSDFEKYFEKWLFNQVEKNGRVFVYYSGHGAPDPRTGSAYIVPYDGDPAFIAETGYALNRLYEALGRLPAREVIVALDSCFSGVGGRSVLAKGARPLVMNLKGAAPLPGNLTVLSASAGDQVSSTYYEKGHGLFTYFLLEGLKKEDVVNPDGSLKMPDLFAYVKPHVERIARKQYNNEQTPQLIESK